MILIYLVILVYWIIGFFITLWLQTAFQKVTIGDILFSLLLGAIWISFPIGILIGWFFDEGKDIVVYKGKKK